ncbi:MAG: energy transducer TonB [Bacteroidota bacterium]|nr:energy transducer TonB [Bacteroidota bacterium]
MRKLNFILFVIIGLSSFAQMEMPAFFQTGVQDVSENYGGKAELKRIIDYHMQYPENALKNKKEGNVDIKYVCSDKGLIVSYSIISSSDKELETEAIRLFKLLLFKPAVKEDQPVAYEHYITIPFSISKYKKALKRRDKTSANSAKLVEDTSFVIHERADKQPNFIYGTDSLLQYISSELEYPQEAKVKSIEGVVVLSFVVEPNGFISNLNVEKSVGGGCQEEAIRVIGQTKWNPAQKDKKLIRCRMTYSVVFKLNDGFKDNSQGTQRIGGY